MNYELKISIISAQDPLYDTVCCMNKQLHSSNIINTNYDTYRTGLFGNLKNFKTGLLLLPLHPGTHQYCLGSLWTFTNSLFIKHCISNK